ncbi:FERM, ARHGEF and pleckstrin domain-containing protein 1-like [Oppia nitens]|uniref:FERM, ARHGEF and pleckstrin domain-containing protein 1-like n=1 Tax=Oppia nitens TaxID=1686743 RepID=UPI0023DC3122|nr:FERM, ARHGEF and pleckstrin domain-containing protein 1-like [Oppia nitens]
MPSPEKRSSSAPPDNRHNRVEDDSAVNYRSSSMDRKANKHLTVEVMFLDESSNAYKITHKSMARSLFNEVCETLNLIEVDYFGIEYLDSKGTRYWLDLEKPMCRQLSLPLSTVRVVMYFAVKFYAPDPSRLEDELTRYLFSLQIKRDLSEGLLVCNENTAALMASYIIQSEIGDYNSDEYIDHLYVSRFKLIPHQDEEFEWKVMENHKKHVGQSPAEADYNLLETARRCEMYGIKLTPVKDHEGVPLNLSVAHLGVIVFQNQTKVNTFSWAKIRKLSFKRKRFFIKLHQEEYFGDVVEFLFEGRNECKNFWKKCIEQHSFFRCIEVKRVSKQKPKIFSRGSSFRYSGRTQQQIIEYVKQNCVKRQPFQRSNSLRASNVTNQRSETGDSLQLITSGLPSSSQNMSSNDAISQQLTGDERPKSAQESVTDVYCANLPVTPPSPQSEERANTRSSGWDSTHYMSRHGFVTPELMDNETDDISNDSYLVDREFKCLSNKVSQNNFNDVNLKLNNLNDLSTNNSQLIQTTISSSVIPQSPHNYTANSNQMRIESTLDRDHRRNKLRLDKEYYVFRELVMSERTYKKDIELINTWFKEDVSKETTRPAEMLSLLFSATEPLFEIHENFLHQIEHVLAVWEEKASQHLNRTIGDILKDIIQWLPLYERLIERLPFILERINASFRHNKDFERVCRDFEARKGCYLPYTSFILKPAFHITHYLQIIQKLSKFQVNNSSEYAKYLFIMEQLKQFNAEYLLTLDSLINLVILIELQRDITGMDNIVQSGRKFVRQGCLLKLSKKGYQQRLFFLFSDILIYASRSASVQFQFKVHGHLPLQHIMVEPTEPKLGVNYCFTIYAGERALMVAANSEEERNIWLKDLSETAITLSNINGNNDSLSFIPTIISSNELLDKIDNALSQKWIQKSENVSQIESIDKFHYRSNTMAHVCWHRNCSISAAEYEHALTSCLSGYLLRKFKNNTGWQKLWVVFTHFCLFFYKSCQDDFPLASLPIIGYTVSIPTESDNINKNYVFKLQFKTHVYFFRTESEYTFRQWMEVIKTSTINSELSQQTMQ